MKILALTIAVVSLLLSGALHADTLVSWTFGSSFTTATGAPADSVLSGVDITNLTRIPVFSTNNTGGINTFQQGSTNSNLRVSTSNYTNGASTYNNFSLTSALARNNYFEFTITASSDYSVTLDSISFKALADPALGTATERGFWLLSSLGGFTTDQVLLSGYSKTSDSGSTLSDSYKNFNYSLIGTTLAAGESVTFRFYVQTPSNTAYVYFDDITVTGSVSSIPEPTTTAGIIGVGALAAVGLIRRRISNA